MPLSSSSAPSPQPLPVLIAGGGPVGLTLAALLAKQGIASLVIEADDGYCTGSRAICISRRSQEIFSWIGADQALVAKGLSWVGGRSHYRQNEVLHFRMPSEPTERFGPMINVQQYYIEQYAHEAMQRYPKLCEVRWSTKVVAVRQTAGGVEVDVESADGSRQTLQAAWLVACDGGRSTVREQLGLQLKGTQYEGRYVIVDIEQETQREVERLAWFDPPSNPGSTILMHRQPDNVWRIDYQIRDDEDPAEAVKPDSVLPRVQSHLEMIGENAPWKPLWISIYNAKCLTLDSYRHGRVLFAGDAAHLVPIFGVRGLNSGLDDAANLAWKLALVVQGNAEEALLDSYTVERLHATHENLSYGAKSTEFMAPPHFGFKLMREAALRLATEDEHVRSLINPRQTTPIQYVGSPLNLPEQDGAFNGGAQAGDTAPEAALQTPEGRSHLTRYFGDKFVALYFSERDALPVWFAEFDSSTVQVLHVTRIGDAHSGSLADAFGQAWERYDAREGTLYLIRPDGYVLGRWCEPDVRTISAALAPYRIRRRLHD
ncbi:MAG: 3-(3-hydroxy-phenyl)propionate hydroxylase [Burkholderiales bacterium]